MGLFYVLTFKKLSKKRKNDDQMPLDICTKVRRSAKIKNCSKKIVFCIICKPLTRGFQNGIISKFGQVVPEISEF